MLNESHGTVKIPWIEWNTLVDLITDYLFDVTGYIQDCDLLEDQPITKSILKGYYENKHDEQMPTVIFPYWLDNLSLTIDNKMSAKGATNSSFNDDKLEFFFDIRIRYDYNRSKPDQIAETLTHELRHAYDFYVQTVHQLSEASNTEKNIYKKVTKHLHDTNKEKIPTLIDTYDKHSLIINERVFSDPNFIIYYIVFSQYMSFKSEYSAFISQFDKNIMNMINANKDAIIKILKKNKDKNVLDGFPITQYDSQYYRRFKYLQLFWEILLEKIHLNQIPDDFILELFDDTPTPFNLKYDPNKDNGEKQPTTFKKIIKIETFGDTTRCLFSENESDKDKIATIIKCIEEKGSKHIKIYKHVLKKLDQIYAENIQDFIDNNIFY